MPSRPQGLRPEAGTGPGPGPGSAASLPWDLGEDTHPEQVRQAQAPLEPAARPAPGSPPSRAPRAGSLPPTVPNKVAQKGVACPAQSTGVAADFNVTGLPADVGVPGDLTPLPASEAGTAMPAMDPPLQATSQQGPGAGSEGRGHGYKASVSVQGWAALQPCAGQGRTAGSVGVTPRHAAWGAAPATPFKGTLLPACLLVAPGGPTLGTVSGAFPRAEATGVPRPALQSLGTHHVLSLRRRQGPRGLRWPGFPPTGLPSWRVGKGSCPCPHRTGKRLTGALFPPLL